MEFQSFCNLFSVSNMLLILFTFIVLIIYQCILKNWWYFSNRNVKFIRGFPLIGSMYKFFFGHASFADSVAYLYGKYPNEPFVGIYELTHPIYIIRDPDLVKQITIQDFEHFLNHQTYFDEELNSLLGRSLFFAHGQKWKDMRSILSPSFTGNKMRLMFDLVMKCTSEFVSNVNGMRGIDIELKDLFSRYTTNVIASTAFGLEVDAVANGQHEFYLAGTKITDFDGIQGVKLLLNDVIPKIMKFLQIPLLDRGLCDYFRGVVLSAMAYREKNHVFRPDMIHLMMEARKGTLQDDTMNSNGETKARRTDWEDDDLVAQCAIFFFAGFESTSTLISFMAHELACNLDVQQKLFDEVNGVEKQLAGKPVTYDHINGLKYMEMVISETLRLWPPVSQTDRHVTKPYRMQCNGRSVTLTTNNSVWIPTYGIHMDEKHWPNPKQFDPERFNDENRKSIRAGTYLPFGIGQRKCIASRFAIMIAKTFFYYLMRELRIEKCEKTQYPVVLKPNTINMHITNGCWVRFESRHSEI